MYEITPCPQGKLAIMPRPRGVSPWLAGELESLKKRGVTDIVSLLPTDEVFELQLQEEAIISEELCLRFHYHPIADGALPVQPAFDEFITTLLLSLVQGGFVADFTARPESDAPPSPPRRCSVASAFPAPMRSR